MGDKNLDKTASDSFQESDFDAFLFDDGDKASEQASKSGSDNTAKSSEHDESGSHNGLSEFASWLVGQYKEKFGGSNTGAKKDSEAKATANASTENKFENLSVSNGQVEEVSTAEATYRKSGTDDKGNPSYVKLARGSENEVEFKGSITVKDGKLQIREAETGKTQEFAPKPVKYDQITVNDSGKVETLSTPERSYRLMGTDANGREQYLVTTPNDQEGRLLNGTVSVKSGNVTIADHDSGVTHQYHQTEPKESPSSSESPQSGNSGSLYETTRQVTVGAARAIAGEYAAGAIDGVFKDPSKIQQWWNEAAQKAEETQRNQQQSTGDTNKNPETKTNNNPETQAGESKPRAGDTQPGEAKPNGPRSEEGSAGEAKTAGNDNSAAKPPADATTAGDKPGGTAVDSKTPGTDSSRTNNLLLPADAKPNSPAALPTESTQNSLLATVGASKLTADAKASSLAAADFSRPAAAAEATQHNSSSNQTINALIQQGEYRTNTDAKFGSSSTGGVLNASGSNVLSSPLTKAETGSASKASEGGTIAVLAQTIHHSSDSPLKTEAKFSNETQKSFTNEHRPLASGGAIETRTERKPAMAQSFQSFSNEQFARSTTNILADAKALSDTRSSDSKSVGAQSTGAAIGDKGILPLQAIKAQSQDSVRLAPELASKSIAQPGLVSKDQASTINVSSNKLEGKAAETISANRAAEQSINKTNLSDARNSGLAQPSNQLSQLNASISGKNTQIDASARPVSRTDSPISARVEFNGNQPMPSRPVLDQVRVFDGTRSVRAEISGRPEAVSISTGNRKGPEGRYMIAEMTLAMVLAAGGIRRILPTDRQVKSDSSNGSGGGDSRKQIERTLQSKIRDAQTVNADSFKFQANSFRLSRLQNESSSQNKVARDFSSQIIKSALMAASLQSGRKLWLATDSAQTFMRAARTQKTEANALISKAAKTERALLSSKPTEQRVQISLGFGSTQLAVADAGAGRQITMPPERSNFEEFLREQQAILQDAIAPIVDAASEFIEMNDPFQSLSDSFAARKSRKRQGVSSESMDESLERSSTGGSDENDEEPNAPLVLCRPTWLIGEGDTLIKIAEEHFSDPYIGWLIADLNKGNSQEHWMDGKRIVEFQSRQQITLPVWQDIVEFYGSMPAQAKPENLVTIVSSTQLDREVVNSVLGPIVGRGRAQAEVNTAAELQQTVLTK